MKPNAMPIVDMSNVEQNVFVILSARAISALGFGLSILAMWIRWLVPSTVAPLSYEYHPKTIQMRSAHRQPPLFISPNASQRQQSPINLQISTNLLDDHPLNRSRQTYHIHTHQGEADPNPAQRLIPPTLALPYEKPVLAELLPNSARPSSSNATKTFLPSPPCSPQTSDSSLHTSSHESSNGGENPHRTGRKNGLFPKMKHVFQSRCKRTSLPAPSDVDRIAAKPQSLLCRKGSRPTTRSKAGSDTETITYPSLSPTNTRSSSGSLFVCPKAPRRSNTTPIPRTSPYEAPYFASPPIPYVHHQQNTKPRRYSLDNAWSSDTQEAFTVHGVESRVTRGS